MHYLDVDYCEQFSGFITQFDQCKTSRQIWTCLAENMGRLAIEQIIYIPHTERLMSLYSGRLEPKAIPALPFKEQLQFAFDQHLGHFAENASTRNPSSGGHDKRSGDDARAYFTGGNMAGISAPVFGAAGLEAVVEIVFEGEFTGYSQFQLFLIRSFSSTLHEKLVLIGLTRIEFPSKLSPKESEVLAMLVAGRTNESIAKALKLSAASIDIYVRRIFKKLGVPNRTAAAIKGVTSGLAAPDYQIKSSNSY